MRVNFYLLIILFFLFSCKSNNKIQEEYFDTKKDTIFYMNLPDEDAKSIILSKYYQPYKNVFLNNKIFISIYYDDTRYKQYFIIKEFGTDSITRFFYAYDLVPSLFLGLNYNNKENDIDIFMKSEVEKNYEFDKKLSKSIYNIHKIRDKSKIYKEYFTKYNKKIKDIEDIVNKMEVFDNFSFKNTKQLNLLKRFLFYTRISTLNYGNWGTFETFNNLFNYNNIEEINTTQDLLKFKKSIDTTNLKKDRIWDYWKYQNYIFLNNNISVIENYFEKGNSFVLFSGLSDGKLFIYTVYTENNRIIIKENYLNKNYLWYHPYVGLPLLKNKF